MAYQHKSIINLPESSVKEMFKGLKLAFPALHVDPNSKIVMLNRDRRHRVGLISGGGSGHEPFSAGYVGERMLTAIVAGNIFASPPTSHILTAITHVASLNKGGVLVIVLNYTGDVMNFGLAIESAKNRGIEVESVVVSDDCAQADKGTHTIAGKRGICGALFVFKIAGGMSSCGCTLAEMTYTARAVNSRMATMGVCLKPCSLPGSGPMFTLDDTEMEIGLGIHGEKGIGTAKVCTAQEITKILLSRVVENLALSPGDSVCVIVNGLGSSIALEQFIVANEVKKQLGEMDFKILRIYVGTLMTALDMKGIQISVLNMSGRSEWLMYLDFETEAFAWPGSRLSHTIEKYSDLPLTLEPDPRTLEVGGMELNERLSILFRNCISAIAEALRTNEAVLNKLDSDGDSDCGTTFRRFADATQGAIGSLPVKRVGTCFLMLSQIAEANMGGTSGALYSLLLLGAAKNATDWPSIFINAVQMLRKYSSAALGHRTMLDALVPAQEAFVSALRTHGEDNWQYALQHAVEKAEEGCWETKFMIPKAGRASYIDPSKLSGEVDAGAFAVVLWLKAVMGQLTRLPDK